MKTIDYILAKFLNCDVSKLDILNSIVLDVDEFFDKAEEKTLEGLCLAVKEEALKYLQEMYDFAFYTIKSNPKLYDGSALEWDADLLWGSLEFLNPERDLNFGMEDGFYIELDNWDLYMSVVGTINKDFNSGYSFNVLTEDFTKKFYGGNKTPEKYNDLLI